MTEILLLGTFHFRESFFDIYSAEIQQELDAIVRKLSAFHPDAVAVETSVFAQEYVNQAYEKFALTDLQDSNKMRNETLGQICVWGQTVPIPYNNEAIQIGFRLGKLLDHSKVYAIDDNTTLNMDVMQNPEASLKEAMDAFYAYTSTHTNDTISELYQYYNGEKWSKLNHNIYIQANRIQTDNLYAGAEMLAKWYERNLKIFANIQRLSADHKRIFIIYGAGHLQILRDLINADSNLKLVDTQKFL